ncbi:UDP-4-amino-4,6-dideoxy-N-acetyl-beta-L-altrosamine N-acetyltransferase [Parageobacillus thermoglucosidasius]|uniref:UDP-4-amino-4, 6-dideoxy-N-acetyl-beta-L-altrosamine N-acetyltransferase n=1 Tax=Parageobacillus thermoglucosidasius TaxID=1426 RepID=UPI000B582395|nr:UDP-4-amino-4,6-dideoxy-N-acetyl-beta-L-altrosamine N-acetyltransferase [Parageobacillus thermoglucosidasius]MBY6269980.1 UDP-4-amino-4,6-dideoxy-N-acetyl-beta-L-altrosamine N-acetyltransferase [Parageobacillus thermoglucosidasius]OUM90188.1 MAG: UDP-4-amino-4,6-dideoxy-N-acetyl-beta-L-altrosamine N-acetyltransferase [Parageobacillus thermoglucosidasius]
MNLLERARLEDMNSSHLEMVLNWRNQEHIRAVMFHDRVISLEEHRKWFDRVKRDKRTIVKIFYLENVPVGVVNFTNIDFENGKCSWGFYIGDQSAPKGSGTLMGYLALNFIFDELNIRKLCAEIIDSNERSIRYHQRLGFRTEGVLKKHVLKNNQYVDVILMALFNKQWKEQKSKIRYMIEGMRV